jgi:hypothetical protein
LDFLNTAVGGGRLLNTDVVYILNTAVGGGSLLNTDVVYILNTAVGGGRLLNTDVVYIAVCIESSARKLFIKGIVVTYLLTPWSRILLEKLICSQLVKKFLTFYEVRMFITALTSARHLSLSRASSI